MKRIEIWLRYVDPKARSGAMQTLDEDDAALVDLLKMLAACDYRFVVTTADTHRATLIRRVFNSRRTLRDIFGWNRTFGRRHLDAALFDQACTAGAVRSLGFGRYRARFRVASLGDRLLLHSPFPTRGNDAVFLGPDSYRYAAFLGRAAPALPENAHVVDLGTGSGIGALAIARRRPDLRLTVVDINAAALRLARVNLAAAGVSATFVKGDGLDAVDGPIDAIIANPPYLGGKIGRLYRDGGAYLGAEIAMQWVTSAVGKLGPAGQIFLYSGSAIVSGEDPLRIRLETRLSHRDFDVDYTEIDPDVFGGVLWRPAYRHVDRIAAVTMIASKRSNP